MSRKQIRTRRSFLKTAAAAIAAPTIIPARALGLGESVAPSERITVGCLGLGGQGMANLHAFLGNRDAQVVALCEVDQRNLERPYRTSRTGWATSSNARSPRTFARCIDRADVDAVMISTPDHWHVPMSVMAAKAGKDVICEKPTLTVAEGRVLCEAVQRYGTVYQTSTEDRSVPQYLRMAELVRNGRIGKLHTIHVGLPAGPGGPGNPTPVAGAAGTGLGPVAGTGPLGRLLPGPRPLQLPLDQRLFGRHAHGLGHAPAGHRAVGQRHRAHRADRSRGRRPVPCGRPVRHGASLRARRTSTPTA